MCVVLCGRQKSEVALGFLVAAPAPWGGGGVVTLGPAASILRVVGAQATGVSGH